MQPDDLYGLALDRFVAERGALARALRADGRRDEAAAVTGLRKPSVAAWAVNQLVRSQRADLQELFDAGDALRESHAALLAGRRHGSALRAAGQRERAAVDRLVDAARGLLTTDGHELSAAVVERVADTLRAAALDADAREQVSAGRLERELRHVGLGFSAAASATAPAPVVPDAGRERAARDDAEAAKAAEIAARRGAQSAARALRAAAERRERAAQALREADEALAAATAEAEAAAEAHRCAQGDLESLPRPAL